MDDDVGVPREIRYAIVLLLPCNFFSFLARRIKLAFCFARRLAMAAPIPVCKSVSCLFVEDSCLELLAIEFPYPWMRL